MRRAAALLIALLAVGHAQLVYACAATWTGSQRGPCCPSVVGTLDGQIDCSPDGDATPASGCVTALDANSGNPLTGLNVQGDAGDQPDFEHVPFAMWPEPPAAADAVARPQGQSTGSTTPGTRTYLATLRLRL